MGFDEVRRREARADGPSRRSSAVGGRAARALWAFKRADSRRSQQAFRHRQGGLAPRIRPVHRNRPPAPDRLCADVPPSFPDEGARARLLGWALIVLAVLDPAFHNRYVNPTVPASFHDRSPFLGELSRRRSSSTGTSIYCPVLQGDDRRQHPSPRLFPQEPLSVHRDGRRRPLRLQLGFLRDLSAPRSGSYGGGQEVAPRPTSSRS